MTVATKERPILFTGPMVRAILDGRKTQTRRVVKRAVVITTDDRTGVTDQPCPYGQPGDRLWVRESVSWNGGAWCYRADVSEEIARGVRWKPSIHMPRVACRLILEIVSVRVERVQCIDTADAIAEGIEPRPLGGDGPSETDQYADLWDSINGDTHPWSADPWVWVVEFREIDTKGTP